jgi:hypothetical protein
MTGTRICRREGDTRDAASHTPRVKFFPTN